MDELTRKYRHLSTELQFAQRIINELEFYSKRIPEHCPAHRKIIQDLETARALRTDIKKDINEIADNKIKITWTTTA